MPSRPLSALLLAAACQSPVASETSFGGQGDSTTTTGTSAASSTTTAPDDTTSTSTGTSASPPHGSSTTADSTDTLPAVFDLGTDHDLGSPAPAGCQGKVDLLFVIARMGTLAPNLQSRLIAAFPHFMGALKQRFSDFDPHIMVIDGDEGWGFDDCNEECTPDGCEYDPSYPCDKLDLVTWCDRAIGAGTVFNAGGDASNKPCNISSGKRFLTRDQPEMNATFACIAQVGVSGYARLGDALMYASTSQLSGPGGCNDKFFREDALLMVIFVGGSDVEGANPFSQGTPGQWTEAVLNVKHGDYGSVVMLAIGTSAPDCPWWGDRICTLANGFPYHHVADARVTSYIPAFDAATELVDQACAAFIPPPA